MFNGKHSIYIQEALLVQIQTLKVRKGKNEKGAFYLWIGQTSETVGQTFARNSAGTLVGPTSTKVGLVQVALENFDKEDVTRYTELFLIFEIVFAYPIKYGFSMG